MAHGESDGGEKETQASAAPLELLPEDKVRRLLAHPSLLPQLSDIFSVMDRHVRFLYVSRTAGGRSASDVLGTSVLDHIAPEHRARFLALFEEAWQSGQPRLIEASSNDEMWWENRLIPVRDEDGEQFMVTTTVDTTQRVLAERARRESEDRLRHALAVSGLGIWSWREGDGSVAWDDNIARILGVGSSATNWDFEMSFQLIHEDDRERVRAHAAKSSATGVYDEIEYRVIRPSGELRHVIVRGARMDDGSARKEWRGSMIDVTERKRLEEQVRHVHKMEAVGQLTAGIAHNFNNLLGIILPNVALCRREATAAIHARLDDIEHTAERAVELVRQLMVFTRSEQTADKGPYDLSELVERTLSICRATFDSGASIELRAPATPLHAFGRAGDIEQVLLNVLLNARDALSRARRHDSRIVVQLERRGSKLRLAVDDNGPGIPPELCDRVFEPFFTTKEVGKGTGLGLATAYAIVREHSGTIAAGPSPLGGARITVELPASELSESGRSAAANGASRSIVIVDDEPLFRRALRTMLEDAGYSVLEASDGHEALALLERSPGVQLMIVDQSMPGMDGKRLLSELRARAIAPPTILLTGHADAAAGALADAVLLKPASPTKLLTAVRELLTRPPPAR